MNKPDLTKATILNDNCQEHGSNLYALEEGGIYCINGHMVGQGYGKGIKFDAADYYDTDDGREVLSHSSLEDALEYVLDNAWEKDRTWDDVLDELCPVTVFAFRRKELDKGVARRVAEDVIERFEMDFWYEEYGDFDGNHLPWEGKNKAALIDDMTAVLEKHLADVKPWQCEVVTTAEFTKEEVRELMKGYLEES